MVGYRTKVDSSTLTDPISSVEKHPIVSNLTSLKVKEDGICLWKIIFSRGEHRLGQDPTYHSHFKAKQTRHHPNHVQGYICCMRHRTLDPEVRGSDFDP